MFERENLRNREQQVVLIIGEMLKKSVDPWISFRNAWLPFQLDGGNAVLRHAAFVSSLTGSPYQWFDRRA